MKHTILTIIVFLFVSLTLIAEPVMLKPELIFQEGDEDHNTFSSQMLIFHVDSENNIYIIDYNDKLVKRFDKNGKFKLSFGKKGSGPSEFMHPLKIWTDSKHIYIYDFNSLKVFDKQGKFIKDSRLKIRATMRSLLMKNGNFVDMNFDRNAKEISLAIFSKTGELLQKIVSHKYKTREESNKIGPYLTYADNNSSVFYTPHNIFKISKYANGKSKIFVERDYQPRPYTEEDKKKFLDMMKEATQGRKFDYHMPEYHILISSIFGDDRDNIYIRINSTTFQGIEKYDKNGKYVKSYVFPEGKSLRIIQKTIRNNYTYGIDYSTEEGLKIYKVKFE